MLRTENLQIRRGQKVVLSDVTLDVRPGEVLGVLGPNGAGKSTLLAALCGELAPTEGEVLLDQDALSQWKGAERAQRLAVLPQTSTLDFAFRVEEVVGMGRLPHQTGTVRDAEIICAALEAADVGHLAGRSYLALSGGERQRAAIARALVSDPSCLLADEPTGNLDRATGERIVDLLFSLNRDAATTLILVTHDEQLAARCDRVLRLVAGVLQ